MTYLMVALYFSILLLIYMLYSNYRMVMKGIDEAKTFTEMFNVHYKLLGLIK